MAEGGVAERLSPLCNFSYHEMGCLHWASLPPKILKYAPHFTWVNTSLSPSPDCPFLHHSMQRGINLIENLSPLLGQSPLKMKTFWTPPIRTIPPPLKRETLPNFHDLPDFRLKRSICLAITGHWKVLNFTFW